MVIVLHEHPRVEKYLVIRQGGYLALEMHEQKDEHLEVREGAGLILSRSAAGQPLTVEALAPGNRFHFEPGMEHCLIGTENLLVFERSIDPKGMDQDLVFIYEPDSGEVLGVRRIGAFDRRHRRARQTVTAASPAIPGQDAHDLATIKPKRQCPPVADTPCMPSEPLSFGHKNA